MLILTDRRVTIEDISEQLGLSVGTAHEIVHYDLVFLWSVVIWSYQNARPHTIARTVETINQFSSDDAMMRKSLKPQSKEFYPEEIQSLFFDGKNVSIY